MAAPLHTVVETPEFIACVRGLLAEAERQELIEFLANHPDAGEVMQGTGRGESCAGVRGGKANEAAQG